jgi:hypothetical protein
VVDRQEFSWPSKLVRYFLHGIAFSTLLLLLAFVWVFILAILTMLGFIIGFIIGFIVLFFFIGGLNTLLTDFIWSTTVRSSWVILFIHGVGLFFILLILTLPSYLLTRSLPSLATSIFVFVAYAFVDGFIAKNLAFVWKEETSGSSDRDEARSEPTAREPFVENEDADAELLYQKLLTKYIDHWGVQTGMQLLNNEIKAYTWQGETFDEAVKRVYQRQKRTPPK